MLPDLLIVPITFPEEAPPDTSLRGRFSSAFTQMIATADPYITGLAALAGVGLVSKGGYALLKPEKNIRKAKVELIVGLLSIGYATSRIALSCLSRFKRETEGFFDSTDRSSSWIIPVSIISIPVLALLATRYFFHKEKVSTRQRKFGVLRGLMDYARFNLYLRLYDL